jgi:puromycin-sensitive aminopeptidase
MPKPVIRLFTTLQPNAYKLSLDLDPKKLLFSGRVEIETKRISKPSHRLTLHQKDLKITNATVMYHDKKGTVSIDVDRINTHDRFDEVRLHTKQKLFAGHYTIVLDFRGTITKPMHGLYPCYYKDGIKEKLLLATQFESHHAREVFPCIDEPEAKAIFDLTLITPTDGTVLANTPVKTETTETKKRITTFATTPLMSTYLLAFVYGDVAYKEGKTKRGTQVRTYATPGQVAHTTFALETAIKCLEFYEDYFAIAYPLAKCDMIALPDFASGAMENWGLITYREQTLLVDPANTSISTKQYVAMVVAHELAHQWFGNLVTMRWWTDLWLNEGFASWIEYLAVDDLFPDWQMWTQFIANEQQSALKLDALDSTHPVEVAIHHPDEIRSIFDAISYNKGASVIHMLHGYLGDEAFKQGLRHYLQKFAYKNTDTNDLWGALEHVSGKPVKAFMHAWTSLPGFPALEVSKDKHQVTLRQERFFSLKPDKTSPKIWPIPLLSAQESPERLDSESTVYHTATLKKYNQGQSGFYRVIYDEAALNTLITQIKHLPPLDRLGLLADIHESAKAGYCKTVTATELLSSCQNEDNAAIWDILAGQISDLKRTFDDNTTRELLKPLIRHLTAKQLQRLGWDTRPGDTHFDQLLRPTVLGLAAGADEERVVKEAMTRFDNAQKSEGIAPDLRGVIYTTAARHGNQETYNKLLQFHNDSDSSDERTTIAAALASFKQPVLYEKSLQLITTDTVRRQDAMYWLAYSFMNRYAKDATWEWMQHNWGWLEKELGSDLSFYRTPLYAARSFSDKTFLQEYDNFFAKKRSPAINRSIDQGKETLLIQIAWKQRDAKQLVHYLRSLHFS